MKKFIVKQQQGLTVISNTGAGFMVERDEWGFAKAISCDGVFILHLQAGTCRNEKCAQWIVDRLNGSNSPMPKTD